MDKQRPTFSLNMTTNQRVNRYGKRLPDYIGTIAHPKTPERLLELSLWSKPYIDPKTGQQLIVMNGNVKEFSRADSAIDRMHARAEGQVGAPIQVRNLEIESGRVVIFQSKHEDGNIAENGKRRSDFYGHWNCKGEQIDIGAWANTTNDGRNTSIVGGTQPPYQKDINQDEPSFEPMSQEEIDSFAAQANDIEQSFEQDQADKETEEPNRKRAGRSR